MRRLVAATVLVAGLLLAASGCAPRRPPAPYPDDRIDACEQEGIASWYGGKFHGRRTASGERYDMYALTAAHRTLPFGTRVRVVHLASGRTVDVRINDRGPFVPGRIIDLSRAAATALGIRHEGIARVRVIRLDRACR